MGKIALIKMIQMQNFTINFKTLLVVEIQLEHFKTILNNIIINTKIIKIKIVYFSKLNYLNGNFDKYFDQCNYIAN